MKYTKEFNLPPHLHAVLRHLMEMPLFAGLAVEILAKVASGLQLRMVARGSHILHKGDIGNQLLFLFAGRLQAIDLTEDGREIGLNFLDSGDYFGELSIIDNQPRSASVVACENSLIATLPREQALHLFYENPLVAERVLKRLAQAVRQSTSYRSILGLPNAFQRVFALLNQFAKTAPNGMVVIDKMPTQQEIAITVNTSRETVSRAIHILIQKGVVEKDMRRLIVRHPEAFREAVHNDTHASK